MGVFEKILIKYWEMIKVKDANRLAKQSPPVGVTALYDIPYVENAEEPNLLDVYYPEGTDKPLPVIFMVHGGGWLYGTKEINKYYGMHLATRGFTVININYHLVQEQRFPHQIKDIYKALNWLEKNHAKYFCDINNVFVTGDSAGAHLSLLATVIQHNKKYKDMLGVSSNIEIKAASMVCGVFDFNAFGWKSFASKPYSRVIMGASVKKSEYREILSVPTAIYDRKLPPLYLISSKQDILGFQTRAFAKFLKNNNYEHELHFWDKGKERKLEHVFNVIYPLYPESIQVNDEMCQFFRKYIKS